jgi:hypothetical protein
MGVYAMDNWLLQGLVNNLVWALLIATFGIGMAILKKRDSKWVAPFLYGIVTVACLAVIGFTFTGRSLFSSPPLEITPENIESNLKTWTNNLAITLTRTTIPESYFGYVAILRGADPVQLFRSKDKPGYLQFRATIAFSPEHLVAMSKLSDAQTLKVTQELFLEVARLRMGSTLTSLTGPGGKPFQTEVVLQKGVTIPTLNEALFAESFDDMTRATALVRAATNLALAQAENRSTPKQRVSQ